ncbi:hypothetical protein [Pedobacter sp. MR22-3]|uniref:hypothetical protein n=1 Tax=Pedobacter sp. MR22-3 TaxID=2994552 RepID=UPI0022481793|nr:hypothetical protein [Pedobacter sp. MR22-3]MCX2584345.1 hypothetical protein [Pedobacter sp. MR22-3]
MNWSNFQTYGDAPTEAFETLCNQLFERHLKSVHGPMLTKFRVVNGAAGDGGIEAYGLLANGDIIAVQSKWFRDVLTDVQFGQVEKSIDTALALRPNIKKYIVCIPRDLSSLKYGRGKKGQSKQPVRNHEDKAIDTFSDTIKAKYPSLELEWWFENDIQLELMEPGNEGIHKFWFEKEVVSLKLLSDKFALQKKGWLHQRYIPELHAQGVIQQTVQHIKFAKEYRGLFYQEFEKSILSLHSLIRHINAFLPTNTTDDQLNLHLKGLIGSIDDHIKEGRLLLEAVKEGNDKFQPSIPVAFNLSVIFPKLRAIIPSQRQLALLPELLRAIQNYSDFVKRDLSKIFFQCMRLILGEPGTGKTHGLANAIDTHLSASAPGIIIQAKGATSKDWDNLLREALALPAWSKEEICTALETMAMRVDTGLGKNLSAGDEIKLEATKVLICIDGLEEDLGKEKIWYERMRECEILHHQFPNIRFLFSARRYFHDSREVPKCTNFDVVILPKEGDVPVQSVAEKYFSKEFYNITLESPKKIKGIDSLFALRLFCDLYEGKTIAKDEEILTATDELLNKKIESIELDFKERKQLGVSNARSPISEALSIIADHFYTGPRIEHNDLSTLVKNAIGNYLPDVDPVIDFLAENGMLIKSEETQTGKGGIKKRTYIYTIVSNSIIELIIANRISEELTAGEVESIPEQFLVGDDLVGESISGEGYPSASLIVQNIVDLQLKTEDKLIGDEGFLVQGLQPQEVTSLRLRALIRATPEQAAKYNAEVENMLLHAGASQYFALINLVLPSSSNNENYFGANFLDQLLRRQPSSFERDRFWSGFDGYESGKHEQNHHADYSIRSAIEDYTGDNLALSEYALHDELPLIYAWSLTHIDQEFRDKLRVALTQWALKQPGEFAQLLEKIFHCDDPQIQEDLASVMLGVASRLRDHDAIKDLAKWAIKNVLSLPEEHRNIIVRQGMRSIVERAFQFDLINEKEVSLARPKKLEDPKIIRLDENALENPREEIYPIVHDLAWYVIKKSFEHFLEYPMGISNGHAKDQDSPEGKSLLDLYRAKFNKPGIFGSVWATAAAIGYMKDLGFSRTEGNGMTQESHGGKSRVFTYEEKYTWLAVHYLQGYLSDYVPRELSHKKRSYVTDYGLIEPIPNPVESPIYIDDSISRKEQLSWVLKDSLVKELAEGEPHAEFIKKQVEMEADVDFKSWLEFNETDFYIDGNDTEQLAIYNYSGFHDSKSLVFGRLEARACIIKKGNLNELTYQIIQNPGDLYFIESLDDLQADPQTHTHSNPSDLVWMNWIGETNQSTSYYDQADNEQEMMHSLTDVTKNTIDGEEYLKIPSAFIRQLCGIVEMRGNEFLNKEGHVIAFLHANKDESHNIQEMVIINKKLLLEELVKNGLELIWFVELFKRKNMHNANIEDIEHSQKVRKYLVAYQNGEYHALKFWDSYASNR